MIIQKLATTQANCLKYLELYQREVDVDMLNAVKSLLADVSNISPSSEQRVDYGSGESLYRVKVH